MKNKTIDVSSWEFYLHSNGVLDYRRTKNGNANRWKPRSGKHSKIPIFFFRTIADRVIKAVERVKKAHHKKTYKNLRPEILAALMDAGETNQFEVKRDSDHGDLVCRFPGKHGRRYIVFQICDQTQHLGNRKELELYEQLRTDDTDVGKRFRDMEHRSRSVLRVAWFIGKGGFVRMVPARWRGEDNG